MITGVQCNTDRSQIDKYFSRTSMISWTSNDVSTGGFHQPDVSSCTHFLFQEIYFYESFGHPSSAFLTCDEKVDRTANTHLA